MILCWQILPFWASVPTTWECSRTYDLSGGGFLKAHCRLKSEVTPLDCSGHLIIVFSQEVAMIELSLLASVQLEHSYSCYHCIQLSYVHCWCYMWKVKLLFEMSSSRTNMILSQNEKLYSERCRNTALIYKLDIIKANIHHRKPNNNFILPFFKAVSESFIGHKKGT